MASEPVANRTRLRTAQRYEQFREKNKMDRRAATREWKKQQRQKAEEEIIELDEDEIVELDPLEYGKSKYVRKEVGFEGSNVGDEGGGGDGDGEDGGKAGEEPTRSDEFSCEIVGEGFNPWDNDGGDDDDDDDGDDDDDDEDDDDNVGAEAAMVTPQSKSSREEDESESLSEQHDTKDDRNFRIDRAETSTSSSSSSSSETQSSDGSSEEIQEEIFVNGKDEGDGLNEENNKNGSKRERNKRSDLRVFEGLKLPSNPVQTAKPSTSIGKRTRSHWKPKLPNKDGSFSRPVVVEEISSTDGEYEDSNEDEDEGANGFSRPDFPNPAPRNEDGGKRKMGRPPKNKEVELAPPSKKKRVTRFRDGELQRILLNTMTGNGEENLEEFMSPVSDLYLPLKFKFGVEKVSPPQKIEEELELENLWKELDLGLGACKIGVENSCEDYKSEDFVPSDSAVAQEKLCAQGKHHLVFDEEIGIICKFCSFVRLEIKYCTPDFNEGPFGKVENRGYRRFLHDDEITLNQFQFDSGYDSQAGNNPSDGTQDTVWDLIPGIKSSLFTHQIEGFEFIWRNIAGGIKISELGKPTEFGLSGCIICHAPGTGKTRLTIVFLQSYIKQYPNSRPIIIAPCSVLLTWGKEFERWKTGIPFLNLNRSELSGGEDFRLQGLLKNAKHTKTIRLAKLYNWVNGRGVLGISYNLFEKLTRERKSEDDKLFEKLTREGKSDHDKLREVLLNAGIIVLDEGHTPRNDNSLIWQALAQVPTKKIVLSGTPFQNNFQELYNTIALVREGFVYPLLVDSHREFSGKRGGKSDSGGKRADLEPSRIEELRSRIKPFVHVYKGDILKTLPGLCDSVAILKPSDLQRRCLEHLARLKNSLELDYFVSVTSVHPSLLLECEHKPDFLDEEIKASLRKHKSDHVAGVKTRFLLELIKLSVGEKVLVFSQYLIPLNFLGRLLETHFNWTEEREILVVDGKRGLKQRQRFIDTFNKPESEARVLLASTKACSEGISLVGASRVVLLDVVWNPSVERQAVSRAYRLGQQNNVYVYHLITSGTQECEKICRKVSKDRLSQLVFSASGSKNLQNMNTAKPMVSEDWVLDEMINHEKTKPMFHKVMCQPKADELIESFG